MSLLDCATDRPWWCLRGWTVAPCNIMMQWNLLTRQCIVAITCRMTCRLSWLRQQRKLLTLIHECWKRTFISALLKLRKVLCSVLFGSYGTELCQFQSLFNRTSFNPHSSGSQLLGFLFSINACTCSAMSVLSVCMFLKFKFNCIYLRSSVKE